MDPTEIRDMLQEIRSVTLCTIGPDGVPDPVPMWFVVDPDAEPGPVLWMRTYAASQKVVNLRRDPRVAVLAETGRDYLQLRGVQWTGTVHLESDVDRICWVAGELMHRYAQVPRADVPAAVAAYRPRAAKMVALRLDAERVVSWDHRKMER